MTQITHENSHEQFFVDENILFLGLFFNISQYIDLAAEKGMKSQQKELQALGRKQIYIKHKYYS